MSSTKWQQFWSGRIEASYRFAVHDYLTRPRAYATISTAETCLKLINSSWPDGFARITASYRCAAQGPSLGVCSPPSSWQAGKSCLPRISGELLGQEPWVVLDCCRGSGSSMNVWKDSLNIISGLRIHIWVCWANNSLTNNIVLIYIFIYMYTTIKENSIYSNIFGADKRLESILIKLIKSKISMA